MMTQEYLDTSGARVEPAIHIGNGAFELVPAGEVLPTHIYEPETGWRAVDPDKALIEADTSTWFTAVGSAGTLYEGLEMPMRVTTTDLSTLREVTYSQEAQEFYMVYWLRMSHVAHTYQNRGDGETVDFETYLDMVKAGDADAQIYVYSYNLNPDGSRGGLRQQMIDPRKGVTIQIVNDRAFPDNPLATVVNPNNPGQKLAFMLGATEAGQADMVINPDTSWVNAATNENRGERLADVVVVSPTIAMSKVALHATAHAMQNPNTNSASFTLPIKDLYAADGAAHDYSRKQLGMKWQYPYWDEVSVEYD